MLAWWWLGCRDDVRPPPAVADDVSVWVEADGPTSCDVVVVESWWQGDEPVLDYRRTQTYDVRDRLVREVVLSGDRTELVDTTWDDDGHVTATETRNADGRLTDWEYWTYDAHGTETERVVGWTGPDADERVTSWVNSYDGRGQLVRQETDLADDGVVDDTVTFGWSPLGRLAWAHSADPTYGPSSTFYDYDAGGHLVREVHVDDGVGRGDAKTVWTWDGDLLVEVEVYGVRGLTARYVYTYDLDQLVFLAADLDGDGVDDMTYAYTYDDLGRSASVYVTDDLDRELTWSYAEAPCSGLAAL